MKDSCASMVTASQMIEKGTITFVYMQEDMLMRTNGLKASGEPSTSTCISTMEVLLKQDQ